MDEVRLTIGGMACDGCANRLQGVLAAGPGVRSAQVSYADGDAVVRFNRHAVSVEEICDLVRGAGFDVIGD